MKENKIELIPLFIEYKTDTVFVSDHYYEEEELKNILDMMKDVVSNNTMHNNSLPLISNMEYIKFLKEFCIDSLNDINSKIYDMMFDYISIKATDIIIYIKDGDEKSIFSTNDQKYIDTNKYDHTVDNVIKKYGKKNIFFIFLITIEKKYKEDKVIKNVKKCCTGAALFLSDKYGNPFQSNSDEEDDDISLLYGKIDTTMHEFDKDFKELFASYEDDNLQLMIPDIFIEQGKKIYKSLEVDLELLLELKELKQEDFNVIAYYSDKSLGNDLYFDIKNNKYITGQKYNIFVKENFDDVRGENINKICLFIIDVNLTRKNKLIKGSHIVMHKLSDDQLTKNDQSTYVVIKYNPCNIIHANEVNQLEELYDLNWDISECCFSMVIDDYDNFDSLIDDLKSYVNDDISDFNSKSKLSSVMLENINHFDISLNPFAPNRVNITNENDVSDDLNKYFGDIFLDMKNDGKMNSIIFVVDLDLLSKTIPLTIINRDKKKKKKK